MLKCRVAILLFTNHLRILGKSLKSKLFPGKDLKIILFLGKVKRFPGSFD